MNWVEPRYLKNFRYTPIHKIKSINNYNIETEKQIYFNKLKNSLAKIETLLNQLKINENIYFFIEDLANAWMTLKIVDWKLNLYNNIDETINPTIIFKINKEDIEWLEYFLLDDKLDKEEQLKIADVLMVWLIENLYRQASLYKSNDMSIFKYDDFIHFKIKTDNNLIRAWKIVDLNVSVFNVDWQWIVKKWLFWDPDIKISLTLEEAYENYKILTIDLKNAINKKEALKLSKKVFNILIPNIIYVREDHK